MSIAILIVAIATLGTAITAIVISMRRGDVDRSVTVQILNGTQVISASVAASAQTTKATHAASLRALRIQALHDFQAATEQLETLLRDYPNRIDTDAYGWCRARFRSCLNQLDEPLPDCEKLANNESPWTNTNTISGDIIRARTEINRALANL